MQDPKILLIIFSVVPIAPWVQQVVCRSWLIVSRVQQMAPMKCKMVPREYKMVSKVAYSNVH